MEKEELYLGCKIIKAVPMTVGEFEDFTAGAASRIPSPRETRGYKVTYPDGYVSWSPKETFENAYRLLTEGERAMLREP